MFSKNFLDFDMIVGRESKPRNSDFYQNDFLSMRDYQTHGANSVESRSSRPIRSPLKSINHASKYRIYENFHYLGAHFTEIRGFCHEKDAQMFFHEKMVKMT